MIDAKQAMADGRHFYTREEPMQEGDIIHTPLFGFVAIRRIFSRKCDAQCAGYMEETAYSDFDYGILGKQKNGEMVFAAYKVNE